VPSTTALENPARKLAPAAKVRNPPFVQKYCIAAIGNMGSLLPLAAECTNVCSADIAVIAGNLTN